MDLDIFLEILALEKKQKSAKSRGGKPDFLDLDKDGDKTEPMKKATKDAEKQSGGMEEAKKKKKFHGPKQYHAPEGSTRAEKLKKSAELYKQGDIKAAAKIRDDMEKGERESPKFKPRKSQYTDKKESVHESLEEIEALLSEIVKETIDEMDLLDEAKKKKKVKGSTRTALKNKAEDSNAPLGALTTVYNKGLGAYVSSGSRPGMTAQQWAMARVNSFLKGGKARKVDSAQWKQVQKFRKRKKK
jgi:hypothetical protein